MESIITSNGVSGLSSMAEVFCRLQCNVIVVGSPVPDGIHAIQEVDACHICTLSWN